MIFKRINFTVAFYSKLIIDLLNTKYLVSVTKHDGIRMEIFTYDTYSCYTVCLTQFTNTLLRSNDKVYTHFFIRNKKYTKSRATP